MEDRVGNMVNKREASASLAGDVSLGGKIFVRRLGFGAMRLTGKGIWGPPADRRGRWRCCAAPWSSA